MSRRPFYYRATAGIRITVRPTWVREESLPHAGQYVFTYHVRIENVGTRSAQLRSRRWLIHDPVGGDSIVEGEGVIGVQPLLMPGDVHEYRSFCVLRGPTGWMEGHYRFVRDDGSAFLAFIPRFELDAGAHPDAIA